MFESVRSVLGFLKMSKKRFKEKFLLSFWGKLCSGEHSIGTKKEARRIKI